VLRELTEKLLSRADLSALEAAEGLRAVLRDQVSDVEVASFITALKAKGETVAEIAGFARVMRENAVCVDTGLTNLVDTAGTGGGLDTFNISTSAAFVIAACGIPVAKHGNRAMTSRSGSADMLEALGVGIDLPPVETAECIVRTGMGFMFAPLYHPAMKRVASIRRQLGFRTVFNLLGPLTNPAGARYQIIGVYSPELTEPIAMALADLGCRRSWVVHGADGMDEISICAPTRVTEAGDGGVSSFDLDHFCKRSCESAHKALRGGSAAQNAELCLGVLTGKLRGPAREVVLANAAAVLHLVSREPLDRSLKIAEGAVDSGAALAKLEELREFTSAR
jgi:anthranilate phosphoribosyltransferase